MFLSVSARSKSWALDFFRPADRGDIEPIIVFFALSRAAWLAVLFLGGRAFPDAFCQWDCGWYLSIVEQGYMLQPKSDYAANWAFFPLYPLAVRSFGTMAGLSPRLAAVLLSNAAILLGVYLGCRCLRQTGRAPSVLPFIVLTLTGPYAFYFSSPYSEAFFFAIACLTFLLWSQDRPILAGMAGFFLSATRAVGVFMPLAFAVDLLCRYGARAPLIGLRRPDLIPSGLLASAGLFVFMAYLYLHMGDAFAFSHIQVAWGRGHGNPLHFLIGPFDPRDLGNLLEGRTSEFYSWSWGYLGFALAGVLLYRRRFMEAAFGFFCLVAPFSTGVESLPRFVVGCPVFAFAAADLLSCVRANWIRATLLAGAAALNLILVVAWFNGAHFLT
jgi:hypothetical protein